MAGAGLPWYSETMDATSTQTPTPPTGEGRTLPIVSDYIGVLPGHCGGKPHILRHRIKVKHIADWYERQGFSPAEIVEQHPTISLSQVHAALAYFYDHQAEIEAERAEEDRMFEELKARQPSLLDKIRPRESHASDDPVSPG
jgi:uncharacterized protein (DUF433 family)